MISQEQWEKEKAARRRKIPKIRISLPIDMAEVLCKEFERDLKWIGITACEPDIGECYSEFIEQVKIQKKKLESKKERTVYNREFIPGWDD
tara:strand:+ start:73 stop:345 length:273 start_codon:yes stop_codon:yes gene_type:complete